ncbi:MAG TPA: hypothetical protein VF604_08405 [Pyrinomonadaceae bacterium]|jgi:hypothetical protein
MPKYTPKAAREKDERFVNSWQENSPDKEWSEMTLAEFKAEGKQITDKEDEIAASEAHTKALKIERDDLIKKHMETCDFVAADVVGDRNFGPDSALYAGFGYIRKSEKRRGGPKKPPTPPND